MTVVLKHHRYPSMRIIPDSTGIPRQFNAISTEPPLGVLVINEDEADFDEVMSAARKDPDITIDETGILTCDTCQEQFTGKMAKAAFGRHRKETGHETASEQVPTNLKEAKRFACQECGAEFKSDGELVSHIRIVHMPHEEDEPGAVQHGSVTIPAAFPTSD